MTEAINEQNINKVKKHFEDSLKKQEFDTKAFESFLDANKIIFPEVLKAIESVVDSEHKSSDRYMEILNRHLMFLEGLIKDPGYIDKNEIFKQIKYILDTMREEQQQRREQTLIQTGVIGACVVAGVSALAFILTRDSEKSKEMAEEIVDNFMKIGK